MTAADGGLDVTTPDDDVFRALASEPRRELLLLLADGGEASVTDLTDHFNISRPAVSKHLSVLRRAGLVDARREGRRNVYRLERGPLRDVLRWLVAVDRFWEGHLDDIEERLAGHVD